MRKIYLILISVFLLASLNSCEKVFCGIESEGDGDGTGECTQTYASSGFGLIYDYGNNSGFRFANLLTGSTYDVETGDSDLKLTGSDNSIGFIGLNGTTFAGTNISGADWADVCDSDLLPSNRGGEPTMTSIATTNAGGTGTLLYYFKNSKGKYGLIYVEHVYDFTISDKWSMNTIKVKIQK